MSTPRIWTSANGRFSIDLAEIICISEYHDETVCYECRKANEIKRLTVYVRSDMRQEDPGFCLHVDDARGLLAAWQAYRAIWVKP